MTAEQIIEAAMRGIVRALLTTSEPKKSARRSSTRRQPPAAQHVAHPSAPPTLFDTQPIRAEETENGAVPPPSAEELDRLLQGLKESDIDRALQGSDPPGTYRPDEGVVPWMGSVEHSRQA